LDQLSYAANSGQNGRGIMSTWQQQSNGRIVIQVQTDGSFNANEQGANGTQNNSIITAAGIAPQRTWFHIALSRPTTTSGIFLLMNGIIIGSTGAVGARSDYNNQMFLGAFGAGGAFNNEWIGYIDEFRVTKGVGRYGAAFTPPMGPFSRGKRTGTAGGYSQPVVLAYR
jgi:hypothetical protein